MAFGTIEARLDVRRVSKEDNVRNAIDPHPGDGLALLGSDPKFRYLGTVRLNRPMARHAEINGRDGRLVALGDARVAEVARQANFSGMYAVAEGHGLWGHRLGKLFLRPPRRRFLLSNQIPEVCSPNLAINRMVGESMRAGFNLAEPDCKYLAISGGWSIYQWAACPTSARRRSSLPACQEKRGSRCPMTEIPERSGHC